MKIDERFNKRSAASIDIDKPIVHAGPHYDLGVRVTFSAPYDSDKGQLMMYMTPFEALGFASQLLEAAHRQLQFDAEHRSAQKGG